MAERKKRETPWQDCNWGWNPQLALEALKFSMNDLFFNLFSQNSPNESKLPWTPVADLYEKGRELVVELALPGAQKEDIELHAGSNLLVIKGKIMPTGGEIVSYFIRERKAGEFFRVIPLPYAIKADKIVATFKRGLLTIQLKISPQATRKKSLKVEIQ